MWDKPQLLNLMTRLLVSGAVLILLYALLLITVRLPLFPVREIKVNGNLRHVTSEQLQYIVQQELNDTFFTLDLNKTRIAFQKLPWVRQVNVRRHWPSELEIMLEEHVVLGRLGTVDGQENLSNANLLNTKGERFDAAIDEPLPIFYCPEGSELEMAQGYALFREQLAKIEHRPEQVWLSDRRAWRLQLDNNMMVELGRDNVASRLARFIEAYPQVLAKSAVQYVDLRYSNGFAVRVPGSSQARPSKRAT